MRFLIPRDLAKQRGRLPAPSSATSSTDNMQESGRFLSEEVVLQTSLEMTLGRRQGWPSRSTGVIRGRHPSILEGSCIVRQGRVISICPSQELPRYGTEEANIIWHMGCK